MRKLLLLLSFLTIISVVKAQDPVVSITTEKTNQVTTTGNYDTTVAGQLKNSDDQTWSTVGFNYNNGSWNNIRCGSNKKVYTATATTDFAVAAAVNKVTIELARFKDKTNDKITAIKLLVADDAEMTNPTTAATITDFSAFLALSKTGSTATPTSTCTYDFIIENPAANKYYQLAFEMPQTSENGVVGLLKIDYYGEVDATAVTPPTITLGENNMVSIEQADGADIYYTTNEEDPTTASTLYSAPFEITTETTVKAIAVLNGKTSAVSTKVVKPNTLTSLAEFLQLKPTGETKVNTPLTAIYQCGRNLYLTDGTDFILSYNSGDVADVENLGAVNGDVISFISGTYKDQKGLPEIIPSAVGEKTAGAAVTPEEFTIEELSTNMLNKYVRISDVSIVAATSANNYTVTDATGTIVLYNTFNNAKYYPEAITLPDGTKGNEIPEGEGFTIEGFVSCYNTTLQITPISITGGSVMETVATPTFTPASGSVLDAGTQITIECETAGATIYYTTDETTPSASSQEYTGALTFTEDVTIKAIAIKEGMLDSDVATATYTLKVAGQETATFDFTATGNASSLTTSTIAANNSDKADANNVLTGVTFKNGPIELQIDKGKSSSHPRWWIENQGNDIRAYKDNEIVVKVCEDGYRIESIEFSQISGSTNWATSWTVDPAEGTWSGKEWTAPTDSKLNQVSMIPAGASRIATVNVVYVEDPGAVAGIEDLDVDNSNAPVEYYNLQGIRISADNLTPGIYIRRQGSDVVKILVK